MIHSLLECVSLKLQTDLPSMIYDDNLFTHQVDEILFFNRELLDLEPCLNTPDYKYEFLKILSNEPFFSRILNLERKSKSNKLIVML